MLNRILYLRHKDEPALDLNKLETCGVISAVHGFNLHDIASYMLADKKYVLTLESLYSLVCNYNNIHKTDYANQLTIRLIDMYAAAGPLVLVEDEYKQQRPFCICKNKLLGLFRDPNDMVEEKTTAELLELMTITKRIAYQGLLDNQASSNGFMPNTMLGYRSVLDRCCDFNYIIYNKQDDIHISPILSNDLELLSSYNNKGYTSGLIIRSGGLT